MQKMLFLCVLSQLFETRWGPDEKTTKEIFQTNFSSALWPSCNDLGLLITSPQDKCSTPFKFNGRISAKNCFNSGICALKGQTVSHWLNFETAHSQFSFTLQSDLGKITWYNVINTITITVKKHLEKCTVLDYNYTVIVWTWNRLQ